MVYLGFKEICSRSLMEAPYDRSRQPYLSYKKGPVARGSCFKRVLATEARRGYDFYQRNESLSCTLTVSLVKERSFRFKLKSARVRCQSVGSANIK